MIRVVWGTGTGPTGVASYDAALCDAGVHDYNLLTVSSVIPAGVPVEAVGTAPDLGPAGGRLTVLQARASAPGPASPAAGVGWATGPGPGLFYEATGEDPDAIRRRVREGLAAGRGLREWTFTDESVRVESATAGPGEHATAVVLGVYGRAEAIL